MTTFDETSNQYLPSTLFGGDWKDNKYANDPRFNLAGPDVLTPIRVYRKVTAFLNRERHNGQNFLGEVAFKHNNFGWKPQWYKRAPEEFCNQITRIMVLDMWKGDLHTKSYMFQHEALDRDTCWLLPKEQHAPLAKAQCDTFAEAISQGLSDIGIETSTQNYQVNFYEEKNNCRIWFNPAITPIQPAVTSPSHSSAETFDQHIQDFDNMYSQTITKTASGKVRISNLVDLSVKIRTGYESAKAAFEFINNSPQESGYDKNAYIDNISRATTRLFAYESMGCPVSEEPVHVPHASESECPKIKSAFVSAMSKYGLSGRVSSLHYARKNICALFF